MKATLIKRHTQQPAQPRQTAQPVNLRAAVRQTQAVTPRAKQKEARAAFAALFTK